MEKKLKTSFEQKWAGGTHTFKLGLNEIALLEAETQCGFGIIVERMIHRQWYTSNLIAIVRAGLIGGGLDRQEANKLVADTIHPPFQKDEESIEALALKIILATHFGLNEKGDLAYGAGE